MKSGSKGELFVVATPIGNLGDITRRAIEILGNVDLVCAEDTRHTRQLLAHLGINATLKSFHEHNETRQTPVLIKKLVSGVSIALVSDAGTPLLSDPGYRLVRSAHEKNIKVTPIPGACAAIAALSTAGLPTDRFVFEGFLPAKSARRRRRLQELNGETRTLVFYESSHRIIDCLLDMRKIFGEEREITMARELTKIFETLKNKSLQEMNNFVQNNPDQTRGEFVLVVQGADEEYAGDTVVSDDQVLKILLKEVGVKQASKLAASITGKTKNAMYKRALELNDN